MYKILHPAPCIQHQYKITRPITRHLWIKCQAHRFLLESRKKVRFLVVFATNFKNMYKILHPAPCIQHQYKITRPLTTDIYESNAKHIVCRWNKSLPNTVTKKQFFASDQNGVVEIGNFSQIYVHIYFMDQA